MKHFRDTDPGTGGALPLRLDRLRQLVKETEHLDGNTRVIMGNVCDPDDEGYSSLSMIEIYEKDDMHDLSDVDHKTLPDDSKEAIVFWPM